MGTLANVRDRLAWASTIEKRSILDHEAAWEAAQRSIADEDECPEYRGFKLPRQVGLVPIGRDPFGVTNSFHVVTVPELPIYRL